MTSHVDSSDTPVLYTYVSPLIFPIFPRPVGQLVMGLYLQDLLDKYAVLTKPTTLNITARAFKDGDLFSQEDLEVICENGKVSEPTFCREYELDSLGYLEVEITATESIFRRIHIEPGYGLIVNPKRGWLNLIHDVKYARPLIIESVKAVSEFCAVHGAAHFDRNSNHGNSILLLNPYKKDIVAKLTTASGKTQKAKIKPHSARLVSLEPIVSEDTWDCLMLTANNRLPVWDVKHAADDPDRVFSVDHLDMYRGGATYVKKDIIAFARSAAKRMARETGIRVI